MKRKKNLPDAAAEFTHTAAERSADLADQVYDAVHPLLEQAQDVLAPFVTQAQDRLEPIAKDTKKKGAAFAATTLDKAQPGINDALDKVTPTVDAARVHVQENLIPKLSEVLHTAAELPVIAAAATAAGSDAAVTLSKKQLKKANKHAKKQAKQDAKEFGKKSKKAQKQAVAQLHDLVPQKKHTARNSVLGVMLAAGIIAGVVYALKKFMGTDDEAGWAAHEPSTAYTQDVADAENEGMVTTPVPKPDAADHNPEPESVTINSADVIETEQHTGTEADGKSGEISETVMTGGADEAFTADAATADAPTGDDHPLAGTDEPAEVSDAEPRSYGEGAYVGENPPEGYTIKGNERSMKYHVEGTGGFERTIPDVWFNSEEAAEAAGFTKAQR